MDEEEEEEEVVVGREADAEGLDVDEEDEGLEEEEEDEEEGGTADFSSSSPPSRSANGISFSARKGIVWSPMCKAFALRSIHA